MSQSQEPNRLETLLSYLDVDPANLQLLGDAAATAHRSDRNGTAGELLDRHEAIAPLPPGLVNLRGLIALSERRFADAAGIFGGLLEASPADPMLRFNRAWALAVLGDYRTASDLLDEATVAHLPQAAALKVRTLHHLGALEEALAVGRALAERFPGDRPLMSALCLVAIDADEPGLARDYAVQAGDSDEGLSALATLLLNEQRSDEARLMFERALEASPASPRALLGKGLCLVMGGEFEGAAPLIDESAAIFRTHLGSWIAAGWTHVMRGDLGRAQERFETAAALDPNFAEGHGALAVVDAMEGRIESAERRCSTARRLDRNCLSAALAKSLLLAGKGKPVDAEQVRKRALNVPLAPGGLTISQALVAFGQKRGAAEDGTEPTRR